MKALTLKENTPLNLYKISPFYQSREDLKKAWPKANFPFDYLQWKNWFNRDDDVRSLIIYENEKAISHAVLLNYKEPPYRLYLCYFILTQTKRGSGLVYPILQLIEDYASEHFNREEWYLHVDPHNKAAYHAYKKFGFIDLEKTPSGSMRMKKSLF